MIVNTWLNKQNKTNKSINNKINKKESGADLGDDNGVLVTDDDDGDDDDT